METVLNPQLPYIAPIYRGLPIGGGIEIEGLISLDSHGFKICLLCTGNETNNVPLQIEINTFNHTVMLSSVLNSERSENIVLSNIILKSKERFNIIIQSQLTQYIIIINNQICGHYPRSTQMEQPSYVAIEGQVSIEKICSSTTLNGFKHNSVSPPPTYEEVSQQSKTNYGTCPLPDPLPATTTYPTTAPVASEVVGYQTFLVQTGTYPLQSAAIAQTNHLSHSLNTRHIRRSNYKTYLGWMCVAFIVIILLLAIMFKRNQHERIHKHRHEWFQDY